MFDYDLKYAKSTPKCIHHTDSITSTVQFPPSWPALLTCCFSTTHCTSTWCSKRTLPKPSEWRRNRRGKLFRTPCIYSAALHSAGGFECGGTYGSTPSKGNARLEIRQGEQKAWIKQARKKVCVSKRKKDIKKKPSMFTIEDSSLWGVTVRIWELRRSLEPQTNLLSCMKIVHPQSCLRIWWRCLRQCFLFFFLHRGLPEQTWAQGSRICDV